MEIPRFLSVQQYVILMRTFFLCSITLLSIIYVKADYIYKVTSENNVCKEFRCNGNPLAFIEIGQDVDLFDKSHSELC